MGIVVVDKAYKNILTSMSPEQKALFNYCGARVGMAFLKVLACGVFTRPQPAVHQGGGIVPCAPVFALHDEYISSLLQESTLHGMTMGEWIATARLQHGDGLFPLGSPGTCMQMPAFVCSLLRREVWFTLALESSTPWDAASDAKALHREVADLVRNYPALGQTVPISDTTCQALARIPKPGRLLVDVCGLN